MAASLERKEGDALALFINGDLQFDSADEKIYHEALALPALALAARRIQSPLKVLVIGGGDGLIAREIFKSSRVARLDLVDYDGQILELAKTDLSAINRGSLTDPRITIHVQDAWAFVDQALVQNGTYDVIVSDLTVAENALEARFHSVDWYAKLARLLSKDGILAVNGVSPQATPQAFWCIFNSMTKANLHARPYHITLPSFVASGFGDDWGFFIASDRSISADELDNDLSLAAPREFLRDSSDLLQLFVFPEELLAYQPDSLPALAGSDILIHYFNNAVPLTDTSGALCSTFALDNKNIVIPEADTGTHILPPELCSALAKSIQSSESCDNMRPEGVQLFLHEVLALMPAMQREQTSALIADFLEAPTRFLQAIDLPELVARLLRRAAELPSHLVTELKLLQARVADWADNQENLLELGHRVFSVLILAIVVGNLLYPDAVYAKTGHGAGARTGHYGTGWGGGWTGSNNNRRLINPAKKGPMGPGPNDAAVKRMQKSSLPLPDYVSDEEYTDQSGNIYPLRRYRSEQSTSVSRAVFRLGDHADILADGNVAMPLTESSYLLVTPHATHVVEQTNGSRLMSLQNDPELLGLTTAEIGRQLANLSDPTTMPYLSKASEIFKNADLSTPAHLPPSLADAVAILPSVCLTADRRFIVIAREGGQLAYLDGKQWYQDQGHSPLDEPYPTQFQAIAVSHLAKTVRDYTAATNMLLAEKNEVTAHLEMLLSELGSYETSAEGMVTFGTRHLPREEAIKLTEMAIRKGKLSIQALDKQINTPPDNVEAIKTALLIMSEGESA
jgi:spermidine synthase